MFVPIGRFVFAFWTTQRFGFSSAYFDVGEGADHRQNAIMFYNAKRQASTKHHRIQKNKIQVLIHKTHA